MTQKQKQNIARFKAVQAEARKLRKKNKSLTHQQAVKQAWAIMYSKKPAKVAGSSKTTKFKAKKSKRTGQMHTDTKSHNVNIRVISGVNQTKFYL